MMDPIQTRAAEPLWAALQRRPEPTETSEQPPGPVDTVTLSPEARLALSPVEESQDTTATEDETLAFGVVEEEEAGEGELTPEEKDLVSRLKARDQEVRTHEAAHISASGGMASGATYTYQVGPDGNRYAIGGEVQITTPSTSDPRQALANAQRLRAAAMAPASPSGQDRAVAAEAVAMANKAREAIAKEEAGSDPTRTEGAADSTAAGPEEGTTGDEGAVPAWRAGPSSARGASGAAAIARFQQNQ